MSNSFIKKTFHLDIKNIKQDKDSAQKGLFDGFASTIDVDRDNDIVLPSAFASSIASHEKRNKKFIKLLFNHDRDMVLGGIPLERVRILDKGLFFEDAFLDLNVQKAAEVHSLLKNGVLTELSIGFIIKESEILDSPEKAAAFQAEHKFFLFDPDLFDEEGNRKIRMITDVELFEVSVVTEPANTAAIITDVKSVPPFKDLSLAERDLAWDSTAAIRRVRYFTNSEEKPSARYKDAFLFFDAERADEFGGYKLPFADVIDGRLMAIPRGIFAAAASLQGARGGVEGISDNDRTKIINNLNRYYKKMDLESPFEREENSSDEDEDEKGLSLNSLDSLNSIEQLLFTYGFSRKEALTLISSMKSVVSNSNVKESRSDCDLNKNIDIITSNLNQIKEAYHGDRSSRSKS